MPDSMDIDTLNCGLSLIMEWGENWRRPIRDRLGDVYPALSQQDLDRYQSYCRRVVEAGHQQIYHCGASDLFSDALRDQWSEKMCELYPWITEDNLGKLFSQSVYYARK